MTRCDCWSRSSQGRRAVGAATIRAGRRFAAALGGLPAAPDVPDLVARPSSAVTMPLATREDGDRGKRGRVSVPTGTWIGGKEAIEGVPLLNIAAEEISGGLPIRHSFGKRSWPRRGRIRC